MYVFYIFYIYNYIYLLPSSQQSTPEWFFSLCLSSLLKGAARSKRMMNVQLAHSEEHHPQVEEVLAYLTDLSVEERRRIGRGQCTLESGLVCPCIEVLQFSKLDCAMLCMVHMVGILSHCTVCSVSMHCFSSCNCGPFHSHNYVHTALLTVHEWNS